MEINKLRSIIKEAVKEVHLKEIEAVAENAAMEARLAEYDKAIKACEDKIATAENLEEIQEFIDENKINEVRKRLKNLKKEKEKIEKAKARRNKGKELVTDEPTEDADVKEGPGGTNYNMGDDAANVNYEEGGDPDFYVDETINESFLKMQKLAGVITEAQYNQKKRLVENQEELTPEEVAKDIADNTDQLKSNSKLNAIADKIANDPKAVEELNKIMSKFNISLNEGDVDVNPQDVKKLALVFAKKAETLNEGFDYGGAFWTGLIGGGIIARYIASLGDVITPEMKMLGYSPSHMGAMVAGGLAAAALLTIAKMVYDKLKK